MENTPKNDSIKSSSGRRFMRYIVLVVTLAVIGFGTYFYISRFWAIGDKQTAGDLQSFGSDGRIIVTFEGRLLTNELIADPTTGISERVLRFSAQKNNDTLIAFLNKNVGKRIRVWYRKYSESFFFRGQSQYVVYDAKPMP